MIGWPALPARIAATSCDIPTTVYVPAPLPVIGTWSVVTSGAWHPPFSQQFQVSWKEYEFVALFQIEYGSLNASKMIDGSLAYAVATLVQNVTELESAIGHWPRACRPDGALQ